ncbi:MAG: ribonuclease P protein component [Salinisphaera sp.]|nr:ribonuclease P protein component [Salinisphaera sp.]
MYRQASFKPEARLHAPPEFRRVFAQGNKHVSDGLVVIFAVNDRPQARLGLALAKRRIRRAVDRNRVKRLVRESFRKARIHLPAIDVVVLARSQTSTMSNAALAAQLAMIWQRIERS